MCYNDCSGYETQIRDLQKIVEEQKQELIVLRQTNAGLRGQLESQQTRQAHQYERDSDYVDYDDDDRR